MGTGRLYSESWIKIFVNLTTFVFAPNNYLVVSDIEDKSVKIFTLEGDQELLNRSVIGYNAIWGLIVQDVNAIKKEFSSRIQLNMVTEFRNMSSFNSHNIYMVGRSPLSHLFQLFVTCGTDIFINMD